jgi:Ca-activated chloride channel homolog
MPGEIIFAYRPFLLFLLLVPLLIAWYVWKHRDRDASIRYPHAGFLAGNKRGFRARLIHVPFMFRMLVLVLLILALARPQSTSVSRDVSVEGIDIVIALDISGSMLAEDFKPNRLESAKKTALDFINMRAGDRIGVTIFSGQSFTLSPLTTDHTLLKEQTSNVNTGMVEDGTAIGDGLATAVNRLRESQAISKVVILLTDGINNTGVIDPLTAAEIAAVLGVRVYTIGVGSSGPVPYPFQTPMGIQYQQVEIPVDEDLLNEIALMTGGRYFWADNQAKLEEIYAEIDQMERSKIDVTEYSRNYDEYLPLVLIALFLLGLEIIIRNTWLKTIP